MNARPSAPPHSAAVAGMTADEVLVADVMHRGVVYCPPEVPLSFAARAMAAHHVHAVVVLGDDEEGGLWGVVSDTDVLAAIADRALDRQTAGGMARTPIVTVSRRHTLARAAELMREHSVTHLLVVGPQSRPVGVLSTFDLVCAAAGGLVDRHTRHGVPRASLGTSEPGRRR